MNNVYFSKRTLQNLSVISWFIVGLIIICYATNNIIKENTLKNSGVNTIAKIQDWRIHNSKYNYNSHEIKYVFSLAENTYSNTWVQIPKDKWEASKLSKTITVLYDPKDPENNKADTEISQNILDNVTIMAIGIFLIVTTIFIFVKLSFSRSNGIFKTL